MSKKANLLRTVDTHKRKIETQIKKIEALLDFSEGQRKDMFLNLDQMKKVASSNDVKLLSDAVTAARDGSRALDKYSRMLESIRKVLDAQMEVSAYACANIKFFTARAHVFPLSLAEVK